MAVDGGEPGPGSLLGSDCTNSSVSAGAYDTLLQLRWKPRIDDLGFRAFKLECDSSRQ